MLKVNQKLLDKVLKEDTVVNCSTEEENNKFLNYCIHNLKINWRLPFSVAWINYKKDTCYNLNHGEYISYASCLYYKNAGYQIVEFKDLFTEQQEPKFKVGNKVKIPKTKSIGISIEDSSVIQTAFRMNKDYLCIIKVCDYEEGIRYALNTATNNVCGCDYFSEKDLELYEEAPKNTIDDKIKSLELQKQDIENEIKKLQKQSENIEEDIISYHIVKNVKAVGKQYIDKNKLRFDLEKDINYEYDLFMKRQGNKIICEFSNDKVTGIGIARCLPTDKFDYSIGLAIAEYRAKADFYNKYAEKKIKNL